LPKSACVLSGRQLSSEDKRATYSTATAYLSLPFSIALSTKRWNGYKKRSRLTKKLIPYDRQRNQRKRSKWLWTYRMHIQRLGNDRTVANQLVVIHMRRLSARRQVFRCNVVELVIRRRVPIQLDERPPDPSADFPIAGHDPSPAEMAEHLVVRRVLAQFGPEAIEAEIVRDLSLISTRMGRCDGHTLTAVPSSPRCASNRPFDDQYGPMMLRSVSPVLCQSRRPT
jgi:hypothetical protein